MTMKAGHRSRRQTPVKTKPVITFEAEPQLIPRFAINWNIDTDGLIVCHETEQEARGKSTRIIALIFVSAEFQPPGICSPFIIQLQLLLKSNLAAIGRAWDKELP